MELYAETMDPRETKDYAWDWTDRLADAEVVLSHEVTWIDRAGTTSPNNSCVANLSRVWLSGGTHGSRVIWTIVATTDQDRKFEVALAVDVVDSTVVATAAAETEVEKLERLITEAKAQRHKAATGEAVVEVWRDGRRIRRQFSSLAELNDYIRQLESELTSAQMDAGIEPTRPRRRGIGVLWA